MRPVSPHWIDQAPSGVSNHVAKQLALSANVSGPMASGAGTSRRKSLDGEGYRTIALDHGLTIRQCKSIVRKTRRIIYEHL